jgi:Rps23 Pro-64 3,4-dihydroxylase Tpa1-like proline 4-hydroxylase
MKKLFELNPAIDRSGYARRFAERSRVQVRDVLTRETAEEIATILRRGTAWGLAAQAGDGPGSAPQSLRAQELRTAGGAERANAAGAAAHEASARGDYAFRFAHYPMVDALLQRWDPGSPHELLLEYLNAPDFLDLVREVTGMDTLFKADGQATLFAPHHYLGRHIDSHVAEGWKVAYVLNFAPDDWHPDWGGYLLFLDDDGDVVEGFRPRFNALNLFAVPQSHLVSYVPPFAPAGRLAITGWLRDR